MNRKYFWILALLAIGIFLLLHVVTGKKLVPELPHIEIKKNNAPLLAPAPNLPTPVETKRQAIFNAASTRNYVVLAKEAEPDIVYSVGDEPARDFAEFLKAISLIGERSPFDTIQIMLGLPYVELNGTYIWPAVRVKPSTEWKEADLAQMRALLSEEEIKGYREYGAYAYYHITLTKDGKWTFYSAGD